MIIPFSLFLIREHPLFLSPHQWTFLLSCFSSLNIHSFCLLFSEHFFFSVSYHWTFILSVILLRKHSFFLFPHQWSLLLVYHFPHKVLFFLSFPFHLSLFFHFISDISSFPFSHDLFICLSLASIFSTFLDNYSLLTHSFSFVVSFFQGIYDIFPLFRFHRSLTQLFKNTQIHKKLALSPPLFTQWELKKRLNLHVDIDWSG